MVATWNEPKELSVPAPAVSNTNWIHFAGLMSPVDLGSLRYRLSRNADIAVDPAAQELLNLFDRETSIRWEDLSDRTELTWEEICRGVAVLTWAGMCEPGPVRVRLSRNGANLLESRETG